MSRKNNLLPVWSIICLFLIICASCSDDDDDQTTSLPASLEIKGSMSAHASQDYILTILARDNEGAEQDEVYTTVEIVVSQGTVSPSTIVIDKASTQVSLRLAASGLISLFVRADTVQSSAVEIFVDAGNNTDNLLAVLIQQSVWSQMKNKITTYLQERALQGYNIDLSTYTDQATSADLKSHLQTIGSGLQGAFFIGDLPAAWFRWHGEEFPIDLYFMDLDGTWVDEDNDGMFENHSGDVKPEIFLGRLDGTISKLRSYFDKVTLYRSGGYSLPQRFMAYVEDDWTSYHYYGDYYYGLEEFLGPAAVDVEYDAMTTTSPDYQVRLLSGYQIMQIMAHSSYRYSAFSMSPSRCTAYAHTYVSVPQAVDGYFTITVSDPYKLFLNGSLIATESNIAGTGSSGRDIPVSLQAGINTVLLKIAQGDYHYYYNDDFDFSIRVHDGAGHRLADLEHQSSPSQGSETGGYITGWLVSGPYERDSMNWWNLLDYDFLNGESGVDPSPSENWTEYQSPIPNINFRDAFRTIPQESVAYAFVRITAPVQQNATLSLGYKNNGFQVWLNGETVVYENEYDYDSEGYQADRITVPVVLQQGQNRLLIKVRNWWDEEFAFSARFLDDQGSPIQNLTYDPEPISTLDYDLLIQWLVIGVFQDPDPASRLNTDFLGSESSVYPSPGDIHQDCVWRKFDSLSTTIDLNNQYFFGLDGGEFSYDQIETLNPKVHFYNQFNCSGARYVENPCLGWSYILDNDYGLNSVGSTKTGSMLYFEDYYTPLAQGKTFGVSFREWFIKHGNSDWDWFYGMTLLGDPTLTLRDLPDMSSKDVLLTQTGRQKVLTEHHKDLLWQKMKAFARSQASRHPPLTYQQYCQRRVQ
ncbi:hypothetical protein ACFL27_15685 [candidate division CSSED10-310 bacterium]|uniref:PA14 domain-containing protein n=1 Tax=candidate division CSSED10-310 bacterium TaxID=2855610 RepID=A0ABV6YZK2_UNCC1